MTHYYKVILSSDTYLTDQEIDENLKEAHLLAESLKMLVWDGTPVKFEVVSAINLEGTVEALTLNEEKQTEKLDFGAQDENNPTD
jgi:hypothetical protein